MRSFSLAVSVGVLAIALNGPASWAQATAQISGTVRDQSGAVLPGVEVIAIQTDTGISRSSVTNETGSYVLPNLAVGPYRLEASLPGFRTFVQTGLVLQVNSSPAVNAVLAVGQVSEQIEVQANAALVETRSTAIGQVVDNERILELPLNGRNVTELISLAGGTTPAPLSGSARSFQRGGLVGVSVAGGLGTGVTYLLDGATHNQPVTGGNISVPFPDALQEFKVETSALSAQSGMHSAGAVTLVTKSGTNGLHGDLFEFVRNGVFNARNVFAAKRDSLKRNQFGGTIGGPILTNRLFFFAGYQGTTTRQDPAPTQSFVPTAAMLAGDFSTFASPACQSGRQINLRSPFVNNRVDPALFSRSAVALVTHANFPKTADACGLVMWGNPFVIDDHIAIGKIDYQWNANHSVFGRYLIDSSRGPAPYDLTNNLLSTAAASGVQLVGTNALAQAFTLGSTYLIGPNMVNSLRFTGNRVAADNDGPDYFSWPDLGVRSYVPPEYPHRLAASISGGGGFSIGSPSMGGPATTDTIALSDDLSLVRGNHQWTFGASGGRFTNVNFTKGLDVGQATFNGQITGLGIADFLTGDVAQWQQSGKFLRDEYKWYFGAYGTDTWKVTPKLTLNYGLRWEPFFPQVFKNGDAVNVDLDAYRKGIRTTVYQNAPPGVFYTGDPGFPGRSAMNQKWANFSPRLGLAWDPHGDGRMSIRAAGGIFYDFVPLYFYEGKRPPFIGLRVVRNNVKLDDPWAGYAGGSPFPVSPVRPGANATFAQRDIFASVPYDARNPTISQWNLSIQRQVGSDWLAAATYMGSTTVHLWTLKALNYAVYLPGASCVINGRSYSPCSTLANTDQRRVMSLIDPVAGEYFGYVNAVDDGGTASYNGFLLSMQRRASRGVTVNVNYTWSHCISDVTFSNINAGTANGTHTDPNNRRLDRGDCIQTASDRRQVLNLTAVAETPGFANSTLRAIATGWKLSPIFRVSSGAPLTITSGTDVALNSIGGQRPNQVLPDVYLDKSDTKYLNPAAFTAAPTGTLGNSGVGSVRGPMTWQFDAALSRIFQFAETQRLELRAEAFNLTNSFRRNDPITAFNSNQFGQINSALDPRILQFALKYVF